MIFWATNKHKEATGNGDIRLCNRAYMYTHINLELDMASPFENLVGLKQYTIVNTLY